MTIGTRALAELARSFGEEEVSTDEWEYLGSGCYRNAYLHKPTGVVYKVQRNGAVGMGNVGEYNTAERLREKQWEHVRIPLVSLYHFGENFMDPNERPVLAMEYIEGTLGGDEGMGYMHPGWREFNRNGGCGDMHRQNFVISTDDMMVPIDMACDW